MPEETQNHPLLQDLNEEMRCGIFTNAQGEILIIHDQELASDIQWIEYDPNNESFSLIHEDGSIQDLGITFDQKIRSNLTHGQEVTLAYMVDQEIISSQKVSFLIQDH